jgi:hypothetical protein
MQSTSSSECRSCRPSSIPPARNAVDHRHLRLHGGRAPRHVGTLGARIGRRKQLLMGAAAFAAASAIAAFSSSAEMVIAMRALLGISGATLGPSTMSLTLKMLRDEQQRQVAIGVWIASLSIGAAIGPARRRDRRRCARVRRPLPATAAADRLPVARHRAVPPAHLQRGNRGLRSVMRGHVRRVHLQSRSMSSSCWDWRRFVPDWRRCGAALAFVAWSPLASKLAQPRVARR